MTTRPSDYSLARDADPEGFKLNQYRSTAWSRIEKLSRPRRYRQGHEKAGEYVVPPMVQLLALREMVARTDPVPREPVIVQQIDRAVFVLSDEQAQQLDSAGHLTLSLPEPGDPLPVVVEPTGNDRGEVST